MQIGVRAASLVMLAGLFLVDGCGSGTPAAPSAVPVPTALNGNWLLTGTLPFPNSLQLGTPNNFGLATTFSVTGNQIVGGVTEEFPCSPSFFVGGTNVLSGSVTSDGTLSMQSNVLASPPLHAPSLQLTGKAPAAGGTSWDGTYTFMTNNSSCPGTMSGPFTAMRIADVTGIYTTATPVSLSSFTLGGVPQSISLSFTLQQGGTLPGSTTFDPQLLSGSVQIQGSPTLSSGSGGMRPPSGVLGTTFLIVFTLNDGSVMNVFGDIEDVGSTKLAIHAITITSGSNIISTTGPFEAVRH